MRHSEEGLFRAIEKVLRETGKKMDCNELFDLAEIKEHAATANRVSDYLGGLWRKGLVVRLPTEGDKSRARWSYQWKVYAALGEGVGYAPRLLVDRPNVLISEEGKLIHIVMPHLTISIRQTP